MWRDSGEVQPTCRELMRPSCRDDGDQCGVCVHRRARTPAVLVQGEGVALAAAALAGEHRGIVGGQREAVLRHAAEAVLARLGRSLEWHPSGGRRNARGATASEGTEGSNCATPARPAAHEPAQPCEALRSVAQPRGASRGMSGSLTGPRGALRRFAKPRGASRGLSQGVVLEPLADPHKAWRASQASHGVA